MAGKDLPVSPLALPLPEMPPIAGVRLGVGRGGHPLQGARRPDDDGTSPAGTTVAGVFTQNKCPGAPVDWCRAALKGGKARALVVNAGNANVFTGKAGRDDLRADRRGRGGAGRLQAARGVPRLHRRDRRDAAAREADRRPARRCTRRWRRTRWADAARGIMTTDTFPKARHPHRARSASATVTIAGIAKGSGMIAPDMATMLCFVATDAKIPAGGAAGAAAARACDRAFNCVTVDSDTSTSDTVLLFATGAGEASARAGRGRRRC